MGKSDLKSGDIQYEAAPIHNPTNAKVENVSVIEDSACRVNFISPRIARLCNLTLYPTTTIEHATSMGSFASDQRTEATWLGNGGNKDLSGSISRLRMCPLRCLLERNS